MASRSSLSLGARHLVLDEISGTVPSSSVSYCGG